MNIRLTIFKNYNVTQGAELCGHKQAAEERE